MKNPNKNTNGDRLFKIVSKLLLKFLDESCVPLFLDDEMTIIGRCTIEKSGGLYRIIDENSNIVAKEIYRMESALLIGYYHQKRQINEKIHITVLDKKYSKNLCDMIFYNHTMEKNFNMLESEAVYERYIMAKESCRSSINAIRKKCNHLLMKR